MPGRTSSSTEGQWGRGPGSGVYVKRESGRVNDAVVADERHLYLSRLTHPLPAVADL